MKGVAPTKPTNSMVSAQNKAQVVEQSSFESAILGSTLQNMISKSVPGEGARARFTANLISIVSQSAQLQKCKPATIVSAALRGEGMGLMLGHGYYVVPYRDTAAFQLGYKGLISLALSTGMYADMDCIDVRQGEYAGRDLRTGKPRVDFSTYDDDEDREQQPVVGYYAYFELKDGMFRGEYWSIDKLLKHAEQYSPAFKIETFNKLKNGQLTAEQMQAVKGGSPWYDIGSGFERMCKKTVLRSLLNSGYAPLTNAVRVAMDMDTNGEGAIPIESTNGAGGNSLLAAAKAVTPKQDEVVVEVSHVTVDADGVIIEPSDGKQMDITDLSGAK